MNDESNREALGQYFTPAWVAEALLETYFPDLGLCDRVVEPSCGPGAFLSALPDHVNAVGVEIDPALAERARANTGRPVILGDFLTTELPFAPTAMIGNPPFKQATIQSFLDRAWSLLPDEGRCGFILPVYAFQTASVVDHLAQRWHLRQDLIPRNIFPGLKLPLCFAVLTKGAKRGLVGFSLYHETVQVTRLQRRYRELLVSGEASAWRAVVRAAFEARGGTATLAELYEDIEGARPTANAFWKPKVRQIVQGCARRVGHATWTMDLRPPLAA